MVRNFYKSSECTVQVTTTDTDSQTSQTLSGVSHSEENFTKTPLERTLLYEFIDSSRCIPGRSFRREKTVGFDKLIRSTGVGV